MTLKQYRARAAKELGPFLRSTAGTGSTRTLLIDPASPVASTLEQSQLYQDHYLLRPTVTAISGDRVRMVKVYEPITGRLTPDNPWAVAPTAGEEYELHGTIEPDTVLVELINQALLECFVVTEFSFTPIAQQNRHNVTGAQPWLINPHWVRAVGTLGPNESREQVDPYSRVLRGQAIVEDGSNVYLEHQGQYFNGNELIYVRCIKPAFYHCAASGGVFGTQAGLTLDTDIAPISEDWLAAATLVEAWRRYGQILDPQADQRLIRNRAEAASWKTDCQSTYFSLPPLQFMPLSHFGPYANRAWGPVGSWG